jgi:lipoprotein-anchoring transpeptidase ErfK/SrfK
MTISRISHLLAITVLLGIAGPLTGQVLPGSALPASHGVERDGSARYLDPPVNVEGRYIVVTLADHRLMMMEGERVIWSAPVGTGRGTRISEEAAMGFNFTTPRGMFRVQYMAKDPVWVVPGWAWRLRGIPQPPPGDPRLREEGRLGTTAIYLEHSIAIHGTDAPEELGQPISAGCIRMSNEDVRRLYHEVSIGTPVIIY